MFKILIFSFVLNILNHVRKQSSSRKEYKRDHLSYKRMDNFDSVTYMIPENE